jgi:N-carbamoyl-L-amino-acid hydrolase
MADIEIDGARVLADLTALRGIGTYKTGVHRPTLSRDHLQSIAWLEAKLLAAGLDAHVDGIGNVLGRSRVGGAKLLAGSHLESQNHAGWLDGPLGVIYALEAARVINGATSGALAGKAVEVAAWCDEEGHFTGMLGSRSYVGELSDEEIDGLTDFTDGRRLRDALSAAGLAGRPRMACEDGRHIGFIEAHIEQGDWLESRDLKIGIVTSIVAIWQYRIIFEGVQNHAGTTRMAIRKDAGLAAARLAVAIAEAFPAVAGPRSVWTTGRITFEPGAPSIIPGRAEMIFQFRDDDVAVLERLDARLAAVVAEADARGPCHVTLEATRKGTPARMSEPFQAALEAVAERHAPGRAVRMPSGAIHDAQRLATRMPAGMLFVPSIGGISHHWSEDTSDADIVLGAQVFANWAAALLVAA